MKYTRTNIIKEVNNDNKNYFYQINNKLHEDDIQKEVELAYHACYGDGNEYIICLNFKLLNLYVQLRGTYSSWDDPYWESVSFAKPYEFVETRFNDVSIADIRDSKIDEVLGKGGEE
jgi:enoyl reductase-like protein